ncbi:MAG: methyltransferase domain-containing protein [Chlorobi bacterium]|nr:methyltransferase domain-containing protein [Chlorobiota bacterium]
MFTTRDIADYYNQTLNHYQQWWRLDRALAVHYGYWDGETKNFVEALEKTNRVLLEIAGTKKEERVLDAGCGVGGTAFYIASQAGAKVTGITISERQFEFANRKRNELKLNDWVDFKLEDYTATSFADNSFDQIWAIESVTSAQDKRAFAKEAFRLLKPGGKLIIADYFRTPDVPPDKDRLLEKWQNCWGLAEILTLNEYFNHFRNEGLFPESKKDITANIYRSSALMYRYYLFGLIPSVIYNAFHKTSRFAKNHYKSGKYQYKALKKGLWQYRIVVFRKK